MENIRSLIDQLREAQNILRNVRSDLIPLVQKYTVSENVATEVEESEEYRVQKSRFTLLNDTIDLLDEMDDELEHSIDKIADSQTDEIDYLLAKLEEFEDDGEFFYI